MFHRSSIRVVRLLVRDPGFWARVTKAWPYIWAALTSVLAVCVAEAIRFWRRRRSRLGPPTYLNHDLMAAGGSALTDSVDSRRFKA